MWHGEENSQTIEYFDILSSASSSFGSSSISGPAAAFVVGQGVPFSPGSVVAGDAGRSMFCRAW